MENRLSLSTHAVTSSDLWPYWILATLSTPLTEPLQPSPCNAKCLAFWWGFGLSSLWKNVSADRTKSRILEQNITKAIDFLHYLCHFFLISLIAGSLNIRESRSIGLILQIPGSQRTIDLSAGADSYLPQVSGSLLNVHSSAVDMVFNAVNLLLLRLDAKELWVSGPAGSSESQYTLF